MPSLAKTTTELFYLAFAVWREARGEDEEVRRAVAWSIRNRVDRPKWWGKTYDEVITKRWQYSSLTDPNDPQLGRAWPRLSDASWIECLQIADDVINGVSYNPTIGADSYYDISIPAPYWTTSARFCGQLGSMRFYDVDHDFEVANA